MSVIPLKADIHQRGLHVRLVPEADMLQPRNSIQLTTLRGVRAGSSAMSRIVDARSFATAPVSHEADVTKFGGVRQHLGKSGSCFVDPGPGVRDAEGFVAGH